MTKAEIISEVAMATGLSKREVTAVVEAFMESVKNHLLKKESVFLRGFGSFIIKHRAAKTARNISKTPPSPSPPTICPVSSPPRVWWSR